MKNRMLVFVTAYMLIGTYGYAANGDFVVNGNLGVGTTTTPVAKLQVSGNSEIFGWSNKIYGNNDVANYYIGHYPVAGSDGLDIHWYGGVRLGDSTGPVLQLSNGNVGIGTTSPGYKLDVAGDIRAQSGWLRTTGNTGWFNDTYAGGWYMADSTWIRSYNNKNVWVDATLGTNGGLTVGYGGATPPSGGAIFAGNVGIGTSSPNYKLDLNGGTIGYGADNTRTEYKDNAGAMGGQSGFFQTSNPVNYPTGASNWWHLLDVRHSGTSNNFALQIAGSFFDQNLYFRKVNNNPATGWRKFVVQDESGSVWINGALGGANKSLSNYGALTIQGTKNGYGGINFRDESNNNLATLMMSYNYNGFYNEDNGIFRFLVTHSGDGHFPGYVYAVNGLLTSSDQTLKKDIEEIHGVLGKIKSIRGVNYHWKDPKRHQDKQLGVLAQEVEAQFPEIVKETDTSGCAGMEGCKQEITKAVDYGKLAVIALQAVKELSDKVDDLEKRLERLENNNNGNK